MNKYFTEKENANAFQIKTFSILLKREMQIKKHSDTISHPTNWQKSKRFTTQPVSEALLGNSDTLKYCLFRIKSGKPIKREFDSI